MNRNRSGGTGSNLFSSENERISESNKRLLEEQNNAKTSALADSIEQLKMMSIDIKDEVVDQNRLLDSMGGQMGSASSLMDDAMSKMNVMMNSPDAKHMVYLIAGIVSAFVLVYTYLVKMRSNSADTEELP